MSCYNKRLITCVLFILVLISMSLLSASAETPQRKDEAQRCFDEWKEAYDKGRYVESIPLIQKAVELDPAYREMAKEHIKKTKEDMAFKRVEMDPLLKRELQQKQHLKRMKEVKEAFDIAITEGLIFDTNPFRKKRNVKYDYIVSTSPHMGLNLSNPESGMDVLSFDYTLYYYNYLRHRSQNRFDHLFRFDFNVPNIFSMFGKKISMNVRDYFHPGTYYASSEDDKYLYQVYNEIETEVALPLTPKTSLSMGYEHDIQYYMRNTLKRYNYQKDLLMPAFYYHITPKTSIFGGYTFGVVDYYGGGDYESNFNTVRGGIVGELTPKSAIRFETGYEFRNYHNSPYNKDTDKYVLEGVYTNKFSKKTTIIVTAERSIDESKYEPNPYFIKNLGDIKWKHLLTPKVTLSLGGTLMFNEYPMEALIYSNPDEFKKRRDWYYGVNSGLLYRANNWLESSFDYNIMQRFSNVDEEDYIDHVFTTNVTARY